MSVADSLQVLPVVNPTEFRFTDADGTTHTFTHSGSAWQGPAGVNLTMRNEGTGYVLIRPDGVSYHVTNAGNTVIPDYRVTTITDRKGNSLNLTFEANGLLRHRIKTIWNAEAPSRVVTFNYANGSGPLGEGSLTSLVAPDGRTTTYTYNADGTLASVTDASGTADQRRTNYAYVSGDKGLLSQIEDANSAGNFYNRGHYYTTFTYTNDNNYAGSDPLNPSPRRTLLTTITDRAGKNWDFYYGGRHDRTRAISSGVQTTNATDPEGDQTIYQVTQSGADTSGNLTQQTDPGDSNGRNSTQYTWSGNRLAQLTDPRGRVTQYQYDHLGDVIQVTRPAPNNLGADSTSVTDQLCSAYSSGATGGGWVVAVMSQARRWRISPIQRPPWAPRMSATATSSMPAMAAATCNR